MILLSPVIVSSTTVFQPMHCFQLEDRMFAKGIWENAVKLLFTIDYNLLPCSFLTPFLLIA